MIFPAVLRPAASSHRCAVRVCVEATRLGHGRRWRPEGSGTSQPGGGTSRTAQPFGNRARPPCASVACATFARCALLTQAHFPQGEGRPRARTSQTSRCVCTGQAFERCCLVSRSAWAHDGLHPGSPAAHPPPAVARRLARAMQFLTDPRWRRPRSSCSLGVQIISSRRELIASALAATAVPASSSLALASVCSL